MENSDNFVSRFDPLLKYLQISVEHVSRERAVVAMPLSGHHKNGWGAVHGGVICALADAAFGAAANHESEYAVVTLSTSISFLRPGFQGPLRAEATAAHLGKKIVNYDVKVYDESGEVLAKGMLTGFVSHKLLKDFIPH